MKSGKRRVGRRRRPRNVRKAVVDLGWGAGAEPDVGGVLSLLRTLVWYAASLALLPAVLCAGLLSGTGLLPSSGRLPAADDFLVPAARQRTKCTKRLLPSLISGRVGAVG
jgi:hypothetical protein